VRQNVDLALILIRIFGIGFVIVGAFGTLYAALLFVVRLFTTSNAEPWSTFWNDAIQSAISGPYWILIGGTILFLSRRLARWTVKYCSHDASE